MLQRLAAAAVALAFAGAAPAAHADGLGHAPRVLSAVNASGASPWHGLGCETPTTYASGLPRVSEPTLAVNPTNPLSQSAAWIDNDAGPVDTAFTEDGGRTWHKAPPVGLDPCTGLVATGGRAYEGGSDPWLSYGPDGRLFLSQMPFANFLTEPTSTYYEPIAVSHADNASDWSLPAYTPNPLAARTSRRSWPIASTPTWCTR